MVVMVFVLQSSTPGTYRTAASTQQNRASGRLPLQALRPGLGTAVFENLADASQA
jgi:hypothetical protein